MRADRLLERDTRLFVLPLPGVDHREVVVRLGQVGKILREAGEDVDRFARVALLREDHRLEEARLRIAWLGGERLVHAFERLAMLTGLEKFVRVLELIGARGSEAQQGASAKRNNAPPERCARGGDY